MSGILLIVMGFVFFVYGGLVTFSDRFYNWTNKRPDSLKDQEDYYKRREGWSKEGEYRYDRYAIGAGTFLIGAVMIAALLIKYFQS